MVTCGALEAPEALLHPTPHALRHDVGPRPRGPGQDDRELLAPVAGGQVDLPQARAHEAGRAREHPIPLEVAAAVVDVLEVVEIEQGQRGLEIVPLRAHQLVAQGLQEVAVVVESGEPVGHRRALRALVERHLDDLGIAQLPVHVDEEVQDGHAQSGVPAQALPQPLPVLLDLPPEPLGLALGETEVREHVQERRVAWPPLVLLLRQLGQQVLLAGGARLQQLEQRLAGAERVGGRLHRRHLWSREESQRMYDNWGPVVQARGGAL